MHCAGWVSLASDREGVSRRVNAEATRALLDRCERAGVERFVYTSTLWTTAVGTSDHPADERTPWNLEVVRGPYQESKRDAEAEVLRRNRSGFRTTAICPGLVVGAGDCRPTSTGLFLMMARMPIAVIGGGGIPLIEASVLALAHRLRSNVAARASVISLPVPIWDMTRWRAWSGGSRDGRNAWW